MLAPQFKAKRFLEMIQLGLTFVSACAVVEASLTHFPDHDRTGHYAAVPQPREVSRDRSLGDLARTERRRREAEQDASRRGLKVDLALEQRQLRAG
jgi:hypothetical protein